MAASAQADLFVSSDSNATVLQWDETTGDFLGDFFLTSGMSGKVDSPGGVLIDPTDGAPYVASDSLNRVLRFDLTGNFKDIFVTGGGSEIDRPRGIILGPDGNL